MSRADPAVFCGTPASCDPNLPAAQCLEWHIRPHLEKAEIYNGDASKGFGYGYSARCPAHDDGKASFTINVGLRSLWYQCHAGSGCDQLAIRLVLIGRGMSPRCLPVPKERAGHLVERLTDVLTCGDIEDSHKVLLALAYVKGMSELPRGSALEELAGETRTVSRATAFRKRRLGFHPTSGSYSQEQEQIKDPSSGRRVARPEKSHGEIQSQGETPESRNDASKSLTMRPQNRRPAA